MASRWEVGRLCELKIIVYIIISNHDENTLLGTLLGTEAMISK